jgi:signal transduction histidine kinase/Flp pilus assembly protein TadD
MLLVTFKSFVLWLLFVLSASIAIGQYEYEDEEFKDYLKQHINLEELGQNPVMSYTQTDSLIGSINDIQDSLFNARFYNLLGRMNSKKGNYRIAIEYFNTANDYYNANNPNPFFIHNYLDRGNMYYKMNNPENARSDYKKALELSEVLNDPNAMSTAYNNLGLMELKEDNMNQAFEYFNKAYDIRLTQQDSFLIGHSMGYLAMYYFHSAEYKKAIEHYKKALNILKGLKEVQTNPKLLKEIARLHNDLGYACYKEGNVDMARKSAQLSIDYAKQIEDKQAQMGLLYQSARVLFFSGYYKEAIAYGEQIRDVCRDYNYKDILLKSYELLTDCYEKLGVYEKAMIYAKQVHEIKERINREQIDRKLADERFTFQNLNNKRLLQLIEKESKLKSAELDAQERVTQLLILLVFISLLGIGALVFSNNQKVKINKQLLATNNLIEKQNLEIKKQQNALKTAKAELEDKIQEMENLTDEKTHLLSIVAHDLRTPLNSILGLTDLIEMEEGQEGSTESRKEYLGLIKESGNRMLGMINTLLNVRKIEGNNIEVVFTDVNVHQCIQKILDDFKTWLQRKSIQVEVSNIDVIQTVYADENLLRQVIENLISNAIKYSPLSSKIEVYGELREDTFMVHVKDFGPGLSKEDQGKLFNKYQRLSARPTGGEDSIGIGLSLVKKLTELMNGKIHFESELGKGSKFCVEFFLKKPDS